MAVHLRTEVRLAISYTLTCGIFSRSKADSSPYTLYIQGGHILVMCFQLYVLHEIIQNKTGNVRMM